MFIINALKNKLKAKYVGSIARSLLLFIGGMLAAKGIISKEEVDTIVPAIVDAIVASTPAITAAIWSLIEKKNRED